MPVSARLANRSLATIGLTALSTATGRKNAAAVSSTIATGSLSIFGPRPMTIGTDNHVSRAADHERGPDHRPRVPPVGQRAADRSAGGDAREHGADDRR